MTSPNRWCLGYPPQPPHVPDGALIEVRSPRSFELCRDCWRRWSASNDREAGDA